MLYFTENCILSVISTFLGELAMPQGSTSPESPEPPLRFTSTGKLLLFGEHAAVYGYPAIGVSLDNHLSLEVLPSPDGQIHFPELSSAEHNAALELLELIGQLLPDLTLPPAIYRLVGDVPRGSGFGSSASLCVALAKYILHLHNMTGASMETFLPKFQHSLHWSSDEQQQYFVWHLANSLEKLFHGSPSGIDTGLATLGGLKAFFPRSRKLPDHLNLRCPEGGLWLVYAAVPREDNTKHLIGELQRAMLDENPKVIDTMEELGGCAHRAIELFQQEESWDKTWLEQLGELAQNAHGKLASLELSTPSLDKILKRSRKLGSPGGKLSGAGGGGAFYILADGESAARELQELMTLYCQKKALELSHPFSILHIS